VHSYCSA